MRQQAPSVGHVSRARLQRRRAGTGLVAATLLALGATACSSAGTVASPGSSSPGSGSPVSADPASVANVTLHIGDQAGAGAEALLTAAGLISRLPFKADWSDFTSGPPMLQAMAAGSVDVGTVGDAPPVFAAAGGNPIAVISALQANPNGAAILVPANSPVRTVAQLRGKTIAVTQGSSADYHLLGTLTRAGLTIKDVTPNYLQPPDAEAAFAAGHVAAWDIWSPFIEQAEAQDHARILVNGAGIGQTYSFVVASRAALANPSTAAAIRDYLTLLDQAYTWAHSHQSNWAATWAKATGLPVSVMLNAVADSQAVPTPITPAVINSEQHVADAFTAAGLIPGKLDFANYAVTTFNSVPGGSS